MFTRIVELTTKPGKDKQLSDTINGQNPADPEETKKVSWMRPFSYLRKK